MLSSSEKPKFRFEVQTFPETISGLALSQELWSLRSPEDRFYLSFFGLVESLDNEGLKSNLRLS